MKVAAGELDQVEEIAAILAGATAPDERAGSSRADVVTFCQSAGKLPL